MMSVLRSAEMMLTIIYTKDIRNDMRKGKRLLVMSI